MPSSILSVLKLRASSLSTVTFPKARAPRSAILRFVNASGLQVVDSELPKPSESGCPPSGFPVPERMLRWFSRQDTKAHTGGADLVKATFLVGCWLRRVWKDAERWLYASGKCKKHWHSRVSDCSKARS